MKLTKTLACHMAVYSLLAGAFASCSSDPNPVGYINLNEGETAYVSLDFSVAATRADDDETKISKVSLYIFDADDKLESIHENQSLTTGNKILKIKTTSGMKTIYAVAAGSVTDISESSIGTLSLTEFENKQLSSTLDKLKTDDGFLMLGKSAKQKVFMSSTEETMPSSNTFSITLTRLAAKAQVVIGTDFISSAKSFGFTASATQFAVRQTANKMQLSPNETVDLLDFSKTDNTDGTYAGYTNNSGEDFQSCEEEFASDKCLYMAENIVTTPVTGNTTFACIQISLTPDKLYTYSNQTLSSTENSTVDDFYVVGIVNAAKGFYDYVVEGDNNHVICFSTESDAQNYCNDLNGNQVIGTTVSESTDPLSKPASTRANSESSKFEVLTFNSNVYYRVNIKKKVGSDNKYRIDRNTFYKITLNTLNMLGVPAEANLCPTNPDTQLELPQTSWLDVTFEVAAWDNVEQEVDL